MHISSSRAALRAIHSLFNLVLASAFTSIKIPSQRRKLPQGAGTEGGFATFLNIPEAALTIFSDKIDAGRGVGNDFFLYLGACRAALNKIMGGKNTVILIAE